MIPEVNGATTTPISSYRDFKAEMHVDAMAKQSELENYFNIVLKNNKLNHEVSTTRTNRVFLWTLSHQRAKKSMVPLHRK